MAEAELATVARPYARAIFSSALEGKSKLDHWSEILSSLVVVVSDDSARAILSSPGYTNQQKTEFFVSVLGSRLDIEAKNFISLLAEYNRVNLLASIAEIYERMNANHQKTLEVKITSAYELADSESEALITALSSKLGRDIGLEINVDEKLIGGAIILLLADTFARTIFSPIEIPVGTVTAFLGGPFFISLLIKQKTNY